MRDSPALSILPPLDKGAVIRAHDPQRMEEAKNCQSQLIILMMLLLQWRMLMLWS